MGTHQLQCQARSQLTPKQCRQNMAQANARTASIIKFWQKCDSTWHTRFTRLQTRIVVGISKVVASWQAVHSPDTGDFVVTQSQRCMDNFEQCMVEGNGFCWVFSLFLVFLALLSGKADQSTPFATCNGLFSELDCLFWSFNCALRLLFYHWNDQVSLLDVFLFCFIFICSQLFLTFFVFFFPQNFVLFCFVLFCFVDVFVVFYLFYSHLNEKALIKMKVEKNAMEKKIDDVWSECFSI